MGGLVTKRQHETPAAYHSILNQYEGRCHWLKGSTFLRDLESDSVDSDILDEELRSLELAEEKTCRRQTTKMLDSSPLQIALCVLVVLDAAIVLSEILIDLHAMRSQSVAATKDLALSIVFIEDRFADELTGFDYDHHSIKDMLDHLADVESSQQAARHRRSPPDCLWSVEDRVQYCRSLLLTSSSLQPHHSLNLPYSLDATVGMDRSYHQRSRRGRAIKSAIPSSYNADETVDAVAVASARHDSPSPHRRRPKITEQKNRRSATDDQQSDSMSALSMTSSTPAAKSHDVSKSEHHVHYYKKNVKSLLKAAHILHYCSIAILGVFVIQVFIRLFAMGTEFFAEKLEMFDAIIIIASFVLDVVFLEGVTEVSEGNEAVALIMVFLLWRLLRIVNGLMVTSKKRHEFRIKLQKRARQRLEKRLETIREDYDLLDKEKSNLRNLCTNKGATTEEIAACKPRRRTVVQMTTMTGLSSIASLSLGLSMSMSAGQAGLADRNAKLRSQLSMYAAPTDGPMESKLRRASDDTATEPTTADGRGPSDAQRPAVFRQPALVPSPIKEKPSSLDATSASDADVSDGHVTVMSF